MKIYLDSIGCRLNHSEIETLARQLIASGHEITSDPAEADKVVINTCAVTTEAARDARKATRRIHKQNEGAEIFLTGCYATLEPTQLAQLDGVAQVVVNKQKEQIARMLDPKAVLDLPKYEQEPIMREFHAGTGSHTRAFIKVQDGCDNKCTFCVTTVARGGSVSRHLGDIVAEIRALHTAGYREAVLTGVHLGSYGFDFGNMAGLKELVQVILRETDIPRLRLSSLEPWDIPDGFFTLWENRRLLPHLHMPLQSGSDSVLKRMARRTRRAPFRALVAAARANIPDLNLTTDVIVGFPGETEKEFGESLDFVREIGFSRLHAFPYSIRPGTAAASMPGQLSKPEKKVRMQEMLALGRELGDRFHAQYAGKTVNVLWESVLGADENGLRLSGYTDNYIRITAGGSQHILNEVRPAKVVETRHDGVSGQLIEAFDEGDNGERV